jgi:dipeptidyl aminopeptidase/acylaminoacyl peptidase
MKKVITLVLAIALVLSSVVALAAGTPNINSFATMKVKYVGAKFGNQNWNKNANYYLITLSKPVDRLLVKWAEKGAEPEELAVGEDLTATAIAWGHKYMPGTSQYYATWVSVNNLEVYDEVILGYDVETSEAVYTSWLDSSSGSALALEYETVGPERELVPETNRSIADQIADYKAAYPGNDDYDYIIVEPVQYVDEDGNTVWSYGYIMLDCIEDGLNVSVVNATPDQTAFMTVQGEWAVYYNRHGDIVGVEPFVDGMF